MSLPARAALLVDLDAAFVTEFAPVLARLGVGHIERARPAEALTALRALRPRVIVLSGGADPARRRLLCRQLRQRTLAPIVVVVDTNGDDALAFSREPSIDACLVRAVGLAALAGQLPAVMSRTSTREPTRWLDRVEDAGREVLDAIHNYRLQRTPPPIRLVS